jgi:hypothetical protein
MTKTVATVPGELDGDISMLTHAVDRVLNLPETPENQAVMEDIQRLIREAEAKARGLVAIAK